MRFLCIGLVISVLMQPALSIWCYRCVSSHPGCGLDNFDWRYYWSHKCGDPNDKCVKIIEQKGAEVVVTRDCLSSLGHRKDIPADHYEGCREASFDPILGHYTFNTIDELDIKREYYDKTQFCFCSFDERCNGSTSLFISTTLIFSVLALHFHWFY